MLAKTYSAAVVGIDAFLVEVEINATKAGENSIVSIVGLPDAAVKESRDRVRSAMQNCGYPHPQGMTVINLAPADLRKEGTAFDLPIAMGLLAASGFIDREKLAAAAIAGELALNGRVRPIRGVLPIAMRMREEKQLNALLVPEENASEAALAAGDLPVFPIANLQDAVDFFNGKPMLPYTGKLEDGNVANLRQPDFCEVKGQSIARRAMEIAAAGGHNSLLCGPPGTGKSMIAMRLPGILPPMTLEETLETSRIHSVLGMLEPGRPLLRTRPFVSPHHTASDVGMIGGGKNPAPGSISRAHNGVLFLDELPEFKRNVLEVLRQPLESGNVSVSRANGNYTFPAKFILVAAMNPCPCGMSSVHGCRCKPNEIRKYRGRISGPLLDRIDLHVEVMRLDEDELIKVPDGESSADILKRVIVARAIQSERFAGTGIFCNAHMTPRDLQKCCRIGHGSETLLRNAIRRFSLSPRAYDRILKVARTIADLGGAPNIEEAHLYEAVNYRNYDRTDW
ncbi:MAG: YifB family Mg chelatase-like AAA ATPase [Victivallaceae bacterium]|nr:YifB family Mg chelatase-like AAA ATPase [Victivallaceae bacterium]MDD3116770.1 YifB family Mg chelatase-like AAA ATPase [Victivallaceae bacterium]MDD4317830.1 YifB family Mg chelatase-like AAA ATPase [Victivallaceae bacterium]NLK83263.1 YifB family Mg chelatase-like AAA ATPase [Lentisphaerota bacterium]